MSEVSNQQKRIDHLINTTSKRPSSLDVSKDQFEAMVKELRHDRRYPAKLPDDANDLTYLVLFGVHFCRGRS